MENTMSSTIVLDEYATIGYTKMAIILNNRNKRIPKVNLPKVFVVKDGTYNINLVIKD
jgi:hypothetical protein